jgi:arylsulfatase A-like enzyme
MNTDERGSCLSRRDLLAGAALAPFAGKPRSPNRRPNVVMFMTDDHGAWATGAYGCKDIHTPNIDRLAATGIRFTNAFACTPVCSPSRMTYMTGTLPSTHGVQDWLAPEDSSGPTARRWLAGHRTYTELLAQKGYRLGMCGKWHMGEDDKAQAGFEYWASVPGGSGPYRNAEFVVNGKPTKVPGFKTDAVGDFAIDFLNRQTKDHPFYLLIPFYAPHTPYNYLPETYRAPYADAQFSCFPDSPMSPWQNPELADLHGKREPKLAYSALVTAADANVGRIVKRLEELGFREDTLVVFTADQGWNAGQHGVWGKGNGTVPFNLYEESLRVPLIWNHPGRIAAGKTVDALVSSYDYFPTILDYLGVSAPADPKRAGRSYADFVRGKSPHWRDRLYFEYGYVRGLRTRNLKYIERADGWPTEMFDLEADPGEARDVANLPVYRKQREAFHAELTQYFAAMGAPAIEDWQSTTKQMLPTENHPAPVDLFRSGDAGVHTYRIPALIETLKGTLLAVCDARHESARDMPARISLVMRSSKDQGKTWSPAVTIRQVPEGGVGDASLLLDRRTGRVWCFHSYGPPGIGWATAEPGARTGPKTFQFHAIHSDDEGATWSEPVDLTPQVKEPAWQAMFATSGTHIQTGKGRYLVPLVVRDEHGVVSSRNAWSDDAGTTWGVGLAIGPGTDESKCVELPNGAIMQNMRNGVTRAIAFSGDGGLTFGPVEHTGNLIDPVCNAAIVRFGDRLLFSNAASHKRENLTVKICEDNGRTWYTYWVLHPGPSAYSTMAVLRDGALAVMYECGDTSPYERIRFQRLPLH